MREFLSAAKSGVVQLAALGILWASVATAGYGGPLESLVLGFVGFMWAAAAVFPLVAARRVVRAGLDELDVAEAVASSVVARDANVEYELARTARLSKRLATPWARAAFLLVSAVMLLGAFPMLLSDTFRGGFSRFGLARLVQFLGASGATALLLGLAIKPNLMIAVLTRGTPEFGSVWRKLWAGPVGRWFFKLSGIGLKKGKALRAPEAAPTEVLLGRAAGELFEQLPKDLRARLGDMQDVIGRLERAAVALRARRDELATVIADVGEPEGTARRGAVVSELQTAKAAAEDRLATAVSALENLRLDMLRLKAGVGHPDDLTAAIEEARSVGEAVDVELAARQEVESLG